MFDLFTSIFGDQKIEKVESDLQTRIHDLEKWAAQKDEAALDRMIERQKRHYAKKEDIEAFERAWRIDLEWAHLHALHRKSKNEDDKSSIEGKKSLTAAYKAYAAAQTGDWEWAKTLLRQARIYSYGQHWDKMWHVVERIVSMLNVEPDQADIKEEFAKELYTRFEVVDDERRKQFREAVLAETPLAWMEAMYEATRRCRSLEGLISDELLSVAKEGRWEEWIQVARRNNHYEYINLEERQKSDEIVMLGPKTGDAGRQKTKLGQYIKTFEREEYKKANANRLWSIFWWACGFWPRFSHYATYEPQKRGDKWFLSLPTPEELTDEQRMDLLECCMENVNRDAKYEKAIENLQKRVDEIRAVFKPDSEYWYEIIEKCIGISPVRIEDDRK